MKPKKPSKSTRDGEAQNDLSILEETDLSNGSTTSVLLQLVLKVTEVLSSYSSLKDEIRDLQSEIKTLKDTNKDLLERVEILENGSNEWSQNGNQRHLSASPSDINAMTAAVAEELQARDDKQLNLVIQGLPEHTAAGADPPTEDDEKDLVIKMLKDSTEVHNPQIVRVFRMGKSAPDRPRPIKVMCENSATRKTILTNAKKLKDLPVGHIHKKVFIRPDLTQLQRDLDYKRRQELRQRNMSAQADQAQQTRRSPGRSNSQRQVRPPERFR